MSADAVSQPVDPTDDGTRSSSKRKRPEPTTTPTDSLKSSTKVSKLFHNHGTESSPPVPKTSSVSVGNMEKLRKEKQQLSAQLQKAALEKQQLQKQLANILPKQQRSTTASQPFSWMTFLRETECHFRALALCCLNSDTIHRYVPDSDSFSSKHRYLRRCLVHLMKAMRSRYGKLTKATNTPWVKCRWTTWCERPTGALGSDLEFTRSFMRVHAAEFKSHQNIFDSDYGTAVLQLRYLSKFSSKTIPCISKALGGGQHRIEFITTSRQQLKEMENQTPYFELRQIPNLLDLHINFQRQYRALRIATADVDHPELLLSPHLDTIVDQTSQFKATSSVNRQDSKPVSAVPSASDGFDNLQQHVIASCLNGPIGGVTLVRGGAGTGKTHTVCGIVNEQATKIRSDMLKHIDTICQRYPLNKELSRKDLQAAFEALEKMFDNSLKQRILIAASTRLAMDAVTTKLKALFLTNQENSGTLLDSNFFVCVDSAGPRAATSVKFGLKQKCKPLPVGYGNRDAMMAQLKLLLKRKLPSKNGHILTLAAKYWLMRRNDAIQAIPAGVERERFVVSHCFVVVATVNSCGHRAVGSELDVDGRLTCTSFDMVIVDDATQATELATLCVN